MSEREAVGNIRQSSQTRRSFFRTFGASVIGAPFLTRCLPQRELRVANWADLIGLTTISDFEREFGCTVLYENYSSNEELRAKLHLQDYVYDVVFPSDYMVEQLAREEILRELPHERFHNLGNLDDNLLKHLFDEKNRFSLPYVYWGTGLAVNKERLPELENPTWEDLFSRAASGRVTVLDEMRYTLGLALIMGGYSVNTKAEKEINEAVERLVGLKKHLLAFVTDVKDLLIAGETSLSYAYSGDVFQAGQENGAVSFSVPAGGGIVGIDNMCITANCKEEELAFDFLDFLLRPEVAAGITEATFYATANRRAREDGLVRDELVQNETIFLPLGEEKPTNVLRDLGGANRLYVEAWDRVKRG